MPEHFTPNEVGELLNPPGPRPAGGHPPAHHQLPGDGQAEAVVENSDPGRALSNHEAQESPDDRARDVAGMAIPDAIWRMASKAGVELRTESLLDGLFTREVPGPADGIRYARILRDRAVREEHRFLEMARQDGRTWREIGVMLGLEHEAELSGLDLDTVAWRYAAGWDDNHPYDRVSFLWTCPACREFIYDRGAFGEHPADEEEGHKVGCERLAAASAAYEARFDE